MEEYYCILGMEYQTRHSKYVGYEVVEAGRRVLSRP
jgi:hypothetical protein